MSYFTEITSFLNLLGLGGLAAFIFWTIRGLNQRISALTELAKEQKKTLETVRSRAEEFEKLSKGYKQALLDFEEMGKKLEVRRGELVKELEAANERKDEELIRLKELQLEEINLKKESLEKVSQLEASLTGAVTDLQKQIRILAPASWAKEESESQTLLTMINLLAEWRTQSVRYSSTAHGFSTKTGYNLLQRYLFDRLCDEEVILLAEDTQEDSSDEEDESTDEENGQ